MRWRAISELSWHCVCVGSLDRDPAFVEGSVAAQSTAGSVTACTSRDHGPDADLDRSYAAADLLVLASRAETYGMVVTEALARGLPVDRCRGRRADGGPRPRRRWDPAGAAGPARGPRGARRCASGLARRRRAQRARCAGPPASGASRSPGGRPPRPSSQGSWPGRRDDRAGRSASAGDGLPSASPLTPRPGRAISSNNCGESSRRPAAWSIHDLGCGTGAMGRWLAPLLRGPQHWVLHDRDADLLEVAAAELPGPAADGAAVTVEVRQSEITRLQHRRPSRRNA